MSALNYFVAFGGFTLHNVKSVHDENGRELTEYDGVGSGKFNVPDSRKPKTWKIECELWQDTSKLSNTWRASEIFKAMDSLLENSTDASRLVITNSEYPAANVSVLAWFKGYSRDEEDTGVYAATIELEEYKPVGIKTTDIPYVARPGKVPVPPKVTITKKNTVYKNLKGKGIGTKTDAKIQIKETGLYSNPFIARKDWKTGKKYLIEPKTGKPVVNPNTVRSGTAYKINGMATTSVVLGDQTESEKWTINTFNSIGKAIGNFLSASNNSQKRGMV